MKDLKILHYYSCTNDREENVVVLKKWGGNSALQENKALETLLLPYLNNGYEIIHVVPDKEYIGGLHIFLEKN